MVGLLGGLGGRGFMMKASYFVLDILGTCCRKA